MNSSVFTQSPEANLNELNVLPSFGNGSINYIVFYLRRVSCSRKRGRKGRTKMKVPLGLLCDFGQITDTLSSRLIIC